MGRKNRTFAEISNFKTILKYGAELTAIACNVFIYENMPDSVYIPFLNKCLVEKGNIVFFREDVTGEIIALPMSGNERNVDIYGRPRDVICQGKNGYVSKVLKPDECVIMYDNTLHEPLLYHIKQYAERLAMCTRVTDVNVFNQKTPRIISTNQEMEQSVKRLMADIDSNEERIIVYKNMLTDDIQVNLSPVPYITDKVDMHKEKIYQEFLHFIGIASITEQKKERMLKSEVAANIGGAFVTRLSRLKMREEAIKEVNKKFGLDIKVKFYDDYFDSERMDDLIGDSYRGGADNLKGGESDDK